ncbi:MAG: hypothetical protein K2W96_10825, partial [Gemmataceae bacterium]|nr:hypothetical protein [Gemmataceae bacterium]
FRTVKTEAVHLANLPDEPDEWRRASWRLRPGADAPGVVEVHCYGPTPADVLLVRRLELAEDAVK